MAYVNKLIGVSQNIKLVQCIKFVTKLAYKRFDEVGLKRCGPYTRRTELEVPISFLPFMEPEV
jgi:hypothetical protein